MRLPEFRNTMRLAALAVGAVLSFTLTTAVGRADDDDPPVKKAEPKPEKKPDSPTKEATLKDELIKLNSISGEEALKSWLLKFVKDKKKAKLGVQEAVRLLKEESGKKPPLNFNACITLGRAAHFLKNYDAAETLYKHCVTAAEKIESGTKMLQAYEGLIDMYWDARKYDPLGDLCEEIVEKKGFKEVDEAKPFVLERLVLTRAKQGKFDEAMRMTDNLIKASDDSWYFIKLKGDVQREAGKTTEAIDTYNEVFEKVEADTKMKEEMKEKQLDRIRYMLSALYVDNKDVNKAATQLQKLVKSHPDNPTYKNDLGFIWADNNQKLEESEKLIREALELDQKRQEKLKTEGTLDDIQPNAAYLDSLGWVLFKQKKYKEAMKYLLQAVADDEEGNHLEIWDHVADCHMALGETKEAIKCWEKSLKLEDISKRDAERRRKVTEKMRKAKASLKGEG